MKSFGWIRGAWLLAVILGLAAASCATQKSLLLIKKDGGLLHEQQAKTSTATEPDAATRAKLQVTYAKLPLHFEPNQGQTDEQVHFLSRGSGYNLFLASTEAVLVLRKPPEKPPGRTLGEKFKVREAGSEPIEQTVLRMKLVGANPNSRIEALEELPGKVNYFIGNDPTKWRTNIPTYAKVEYRDVYPGVNLVYYGNQRQLEYDFIIAPGADPKAIQLAFEGLVGAGLVPTQEGRSQGSPLQIDDNGDLILHTAGGEVRLLKPLMYQEINGAKQPISGRYVLLSPQSSSLITFHVAAYDISKPLIIDPVLSYSTYLGGSGGDSGRGVGGIAVDSSGNAYVMGSTDSTDFPTANPLQTALGSNDFNDVFVTKLNPAGSALVYSTYLGGSNYEFGRGIAVDSSGNAYVMGDTSSANFPTASPFQATFGGGSSDAFVTKLNSAGSALVYSTYLGGSSQETGFGIAVDFSGNAYVTGSTGSANFPTASPLQAAFGGSANDAFVTKLNSAGSALVYSTYLGGSFDDRGHGITVDTSGNAYVTGGTGSTNFPTASPFQATFGGGSSDAFVTKLNSAGSALVYSTYLGGSSQETGFGIAVDFSGNAYVTGSTGSANFPTTSGAFDTTLGGTQDAFVTKLNATGSALVYSTYLGGSGEENLSIGGIAVDTSGNAYVTGETGSTNFPTASPFQAAFGGGFGDVFVTKLNATGSALVYSTYLGGSNTEVGDDITVDTFGNAYVTGFTESTNFPTVNPFQAANRGGSDAFVAKITEAAPFLSVPISGAKRISEKFISAVLDHRVPTGYNCFFRGNCEGQVLAYNGDEGRLEYGPPNCPPSGYKNAQGTPFTFNGKIRYVGSCGGTVYLNYDGHSGYDFAYEEGRPILAAADGTLEVPTTDPINSSPDKFNTLRIIHLNGFETWYLHAQEGSECVAFGICPNRPQPGTRVEVKAGQQIAKVGKTGVEGFHLHFEVRKGSTQVVDPFGCTEAVQAIDPSACVGGSLWKDPPPGRLYANALRGTQAAAVVSGLVAQGVLATGWSEVPGGGSTPSSPAAAAAPNGDVHLIVQGTDNRIYFNTKSGSTWSGWGLHPSGLTGPSPAAVVDTSGNLKVFVQGTDDRLYQSTYSGGSWSEWVEVPGGGFTPSGPEAAVNPVTGELTLVVRGTDNRVYLNTQIGGLWAGWSALPIGGLTASELAAVYDATGALWLFAHGFADDRIYATRWSGGSWSPWENLGGATYSGLAAVAMGGTVQLFARGTDDRIYMNTYSGGQWSGWAEVPGSGLTPDAPEAVVDAQGNVLLFVLGVF